ncbi:sigma-54 interaction domain-containing protein [Metabacillus sediminilitoris]|uniref:PAS domain-containing protein n=1 Tax=Metabacillus sediminilitoris TaxID=2567941 RepID=A0A4S4C8E4_9BACI|nr:sigma 54-interacting transcriptional regulator [Metabacillus sediminilitoris]QGQ47586.1 PAS domain-containing protein [Metabacillus sediminilitoris]THF82019.1 PAS domain-containing protein [Metabacillus sediminilitoris]
MLNHDFPYAKEIFETIIENAYVWIVIVDAKGKIIYMNENYCRFCEVTKEEAIGRHVTEVIENSRMHIVVKTGEEEIADLQYIRGNYMIANRIPIFADNKVVGAFGTVMFRDTKEWHEMNSHVRHHLSSIQSFIDQQEITGAKYTLNDIHSNSNIMAELKEKVKSIAATDSSVLIRGESGTGKELFAHSIHLLSNRSEKPFIKVNCGAIPEHLLESELFGYEEGAFTGAKKGGKKGKFQQANGGTIFLDEIGDMSLQMQVKLLRVLQEKEVEPVGSTKSFPLDVRVITATNRPLEELIQTNDFRSDLYYRISVIPLHIPALRERMEDLETLVRHFIKKVSIRTGKRISMIQEDVMETLQHYHWQGNIRELENIIEASIHLAKTDVITLESIPDYIKKPAVISHKDATLKEMLHDAEKNIILATIKKNNGDKRKAAYSLGISKSSIYEKIHKYRLD